jgi:hypothetical protein
LLLYPDYTACRKERATAMACGFLPENRINYSEQLPDSFIRQSRSARFFLVNSPYWSLPVCSENVLNVKNPQI